MAISIFERWNLNPREQRMATIAVFVLAAVVLLGIPVGLSMLVSSRTTENDDLKDALSQVNGARQKIKDRQEKKNSIASRYAKHTPQLGGFIETTAATAKVSIGDSVDRPDINHGKQYVERNTVVHLKNSGLAPVIKFLELLEKSEYPVSVTRLSIRKRSGEPDSYGPLEVGVSTYDRAAVTTSPSPAGSSSATPAPTRRTAMANVPTSSPDLTTTTSGSGNAGRLKGFLRRMAPKLGYPIFYLCCLFVFITWTFPYEKLRDRIVAQFNAQQSKSKNPQMLQIDELDSSFVTGVKAKGVRLISPSSDPTKAPSVLTIDEARARVSLLSQLAGNTAVSFRIDAFDGTIKGDYEDSGKKRDVEMNFDGVDLDRVDLIAANIGFPLDGKLYGSIKLTMPDGKATKANGTIDLEIKDLYAGTAKELNLKTPLGPFSLPRLKIGTFTITGEAKDGILKITKISASGGDVDVSGEGRIRLAESANDAHLELGLKFKINDSYRMKNDKTKTLFGEPGSKTPPILEMDPKMAKSKTADGFYQMRGGGTLGKPDFRPGS